MALKVKKKVHQHFLVAFFDEFLCAFSSRVIIKYVVVGQ